MRILWIAPYPYPTDYGTHPVSWVGSLARVLGQQPGVELTLLHWHENMAAAIECIEQENFRVIFLRSPSIRHDILSLYQIRMHRLRRYVRQHAHHYDVLHIHGSELQAGTVAHLGLPQPIVLSVQGIMNECVRVVPRFFSIQKVLWTLAAHYERRQLRAIRNFSCRTHWDKACIAALSPGSRIFHNWEVIRPEFFAAATLEPVYQWQPRPRFLFLGDVQLIKGVREVLAAFHLIRQQVPDALLVIVGRTTPAAVLELIRTENLPELPPDSLECTGFLSSHELAQECVRAVALLHPSYIDNSPNSVCEAQVIGLPVVATNVGGVSSLIDDGETGLLTTLEPAAIARHALALWHRPELRHQLATQAQAVARQRHEPTTIVRETLAMYQTLVSEHRRDVAAPAFAAPLPVPALAS